MCAMSLKIYVCFSESFCHSLKSTQLSTMSLFSAVNRYLVKTTQGRSLLSMSSGVNKVLPARNLCLDLKYLEIAPGRSIACGSLEGMKPTVVYVPGSAVEDCAMGMNGLRQEAQDSLIRLEIVVSSPS